MKALGMVLTAAMMIILGNTAEAKMECTAYIENKLTGFVSEKEQKDFNKYYSILKKGLNDRGFAIVSNPIVADASVLLSMSQDVGETGYTWYIAKIRLLDTKTHETYVVEDSVIDSMWTSESSAVKKTVQKIPVCLK